MSAVVKVDRRMADATCDDKGYPHGTRKQMVAYFEGSQKVALVHQVALPDGSLGASGLPDPKELLVEDTVWFV